MTLVTFIAEALAALIVGGVCVMMYFDLPVQSTDSMRRHPTH
jgi:hypothetical protein